jgi:hypothetical protein
MSECGDNVPTKQVINSALTIAAGIIVPVFSYRNEELKETNNRIGAAKINIIAMKKLFNIMLMVKIIPPI